MKATPAGAEDGSPPAPVVTRPEAAAPPRESPAGNANNRPTIRRRWWRAALLAAGIVLAVVELHGRLPDATSTWAALRGSSPAWLLAAAAFQVLSMGAFAEQQRHLLAAFGVRMPASVSLAVTYARSAMTTALPGGSAVSASYAFRQFRACGATRSIAAAVTLLSGVASVIGLALLYAGDALAWTSPSHRTHAVAVTTAVAVAAAWGVHRVRMAAPAEAPAPVAGTSLLARVRRSLRRTISVARTIPTRRWLGAVTLAVLNWLTDLACLLASLHAVGLAVPARTVATAYLATQLIRQIPATPGGIGIIEASLMVALSAAGAAQAPAAAAVLIYRLLSCWALLPIGLICWTTQKTRTAT